MVWSTLEKSLYKIKNLWLWYSKCPPGRKCMQEKWKCMSTKRLKPMTYHQSGSLDFSMKLQQAQTEAGLPKTQWRPMHWTCLVLDKSLLLSEKKDIKNECVIGKDERQYVANFSELVRRTSVAKCRGSQPWLCCNHLRCFKKYRCLSPTHKDADWIGLQGAQAILKSNWDWFRAVVLTVRSSDQKYHHNQRTC